MRRFCLLVLLLSTGCTGGEPELPAATRAVALSTADLSMLQSSRIFFGHQSVGRDVLAGVAETAPGLRVVTTTDPAGIEGPALFEAAIGTNGDPRSKDRAFLEAVSNLGPGDVALYKYCYVDMLGGTDPDSLFAHYQRTLAMADQRGVRTVAITMPLTTVGPAWKRAIKRVLGKVTDTELNAKRHRFNELLRQTSSGRPLIDLARLEATLEDGSLQTTSFGGHSLEILASEYTDDGAHLNERGRRHVAPPFLRALADAIPADH